MGYIVMRYLRSFAQPSFDEIEISPVARVSSASKAQQSRSPASAAYSAALRNLISERNYDLARRHGLPHALTYGSPPCVVYAPDEEGRHGNFLDASYVAICGDPAWARRLEKVLTTAHGSLPIGDRRWRELDSAHSSDALLMNVFCFPALPDLPSVQTLLGVRPNRQRTLRPEFGIRIGIPLANGRVDRTEIDMRLEDLLIEAKLTEFDFQTAPSRLVTRYRDLEEVFDVASLPRCGDRFAGYQLIRGSLAAHARGTCFCVICDARRPDLVEASYGVMQAVRLYDLRPRLMLLTWQELAAAVPAEVNHFLQEKYGIDAQGLAANSSRVDACSG
jgi:hypothetical protein